MHRPGGPATQPGRREPRIGPRTAVGGYQRCCQESLTQDQPWAQPAPTRSHGARRSSGSHHARRGQCCAFLCGIGLPCPRSSHRYVRGCAPDMPGSAADWRGPVARLPCYPSLPAQICAAVARAGLGFVLRTASGRSFRTLLDSRPGGRGPDGPRVCVQLWHTGQAQRGGQRSHAAGGACLRPHPPTVKGTGLRPRHARRRPGASSDRKSVV